MPKILLAEDNRRISDVISKYLIKKGFQVDLAYDGESALRAFTTGGFDLLIVNRELPGIAGDALCRQIRRDRRGAAVAIIMMSSAIKTPADLDAEQQELGLSAVLPKPFTSDILSVALQTALSSPTPAAAAPAPPPVGQASGDPLQFRGDLGRTSFEKILLSLMKKRGTGVLAVPAGAGEQRFIFINGAAVGVETAAGDDDFGAYLASRKLIEPLELAEYRNQRKQDPGDPRDLFVKMGCLFPQQFEAESRHYLLDRLLDCFALKSGEVLFAWGASVLKAFDPAAVFMPLLFLRAFKTPLYSGKVHAFLEEKKRFFPAKEAGFYEYQAQLAAEADDAGLFDRIDGGKTCTDLISATDGEDTAELLYTLDFLGVLTYADRPGRAPVPPPFPIRERAAPPPMQEQETFEDLGGELSALADEVGKIAVAPAAPAAAPAGLSPLEQDLTEKWEWIKDKNYYEMFGMTPRSFSFGDLKKAYFAYTRTYGPDKFFGSSSEIMGLAEDLLSKVSNAFETLSNVVSKENYDELIAAEEQAPAGTDDKVFYEQIQFQSGRVFIDQGQYASAEKSFTNCMNIDPNKPEYLAYLALAVYHNPVNKGNPAAIKRAKDLVNKSLQLGKISVAYALKGIMYFDEGGLNFAEAEFNKALRLNPKNKTAQKMLEQIKQRRDEEKKGIFQRIFR